MNAGDIKKGLEGLSYAIERYEEDTDLDGNLVQVTGDINPGFRVDERPVQVVVADGHYLSEFRPEVTELQLRAIGGSLRVVLNDEPTILEPGASVKIPRGVGHKVESATGDKVRYWRFWGNVSQ